MKIPFTRGGRTTSDYRFSEYLMENMIANSDQALDQSGYVTNHFGLKKISDIGGVSRGAVYNDRLNVGFRVIGSGFYETSPSGGIRNRLGTVAGDGQVSMPFSFNTQAIITQSGEFYLYDRENGFREVTDPDLGEIFDGVWIDGYYFLVDRESPIVTDILNEENIRQLNYGSAEIDPDDIRGCGKWRNYAVVFGTHTMEFYDNVGGTLFPFQRIESYTIYSGIVGTRAKANLPNEGGFFVLGGSRNEKPSFKIAVNNGAVSVTTDEVQRIIDTYSQSDLSMTHIEYVNADNQEFMYCHLPSHTLLYNLTTSKNQGHQWSIIKTGTRNDAWDGINAIMNPQTALYTWGSRSSKGVFEFDHDSCAQNDEPQEHVIYTPMFQLRDSIFRLKPEIVNGGAPLGRKETIFVSVTKDGRSFSKEVAFNLGDSYDRWEQLEFRRLGYFNNWAGVKLRYVGYSNLTLASMMVNNYG